MDKEYIEREALIAKLNDIATEYIRDKSIQCTLAAGVVLDIRDDVAKKQPTADVVEVVRCKDCVYASRDGYICRYGVGRVTSPDDYCKNGEKMDGKGEGEC